MQRRENFRIVKTKLQREIDLAEFYKQFVEELEQACDLLAGAYNRLPPSEGKLRKAIGDFVGRDYLFGDLFSGIQARVFEGDSKDWTFSSGAWIKKEDMSDEEKEEVMKDAPSESENLPEPEEPK